MKTKSFIFGIGLALTLWSASLVFARTGTPPRIISLRVEQGQLFIRATLPAGVRKAVLQSRTRMVGSSWIPRGLARLDNPDGGEVIFQIPLSEKYEFLRVQADNTEPLPASFYQGTNQFAGEISSVPMDGVAPGRGPGDILDSPGDKSPDPRTVVESDIWKVEGDRLYFFNQFRGLQIVDITNLEAPILQGTFDLPAAGEQMYLIGHYGVLLARNDCNYNGSETSRAVIIDVADAAHPTLTASLPVPGSINESRMVGTALYIASQTYRTRTENDTTIWEWGTTVSSFDLSNPALPASKSAIWISGYGNTITATDQYLFVSSGEPTDYYRSNVQILDISSPSGEIKLISTVHPAGRVDDKFKINLSGDVLTIISSRWDQLRRWVTSLETFSLQDATNPAKLGSLQLGEGEQLHATRFDGNKVYIVTFFRIDPLWIVDLSNPAKPVVAGELQVPGWSTYIQPLGDRLVTIGIDPTNGWRVAVSLFDVHDSRKPALLDKELLGQNYSWSEATYDEKAFNVLPEAGLILLPYSGNVSSNGWAQQVQLIDLEASSLKLRGAINHNFQPRRATAAGNYILSISARELMSVDATDRDKPELKANVELSWSADRVFAAGDYLLEIESGSGWWWYNPESPTTIRVAAQANTTTILSSLLLPEKLPITGAEYKDGFLYVVQSRSFYEYPLVLQADGKTVTETNPPALYLSVVDARNLPELSLAGTAKYEATDYLWGNFDALWVKPGVLVWSGAGAGYWWWWRGALDTGPLTREALVSRPGYWGGSGNGRLFAFDVRNSLEPKLLNDLALTTTNHWNFSGALCVGTQVFISDQSWEFLPATGTSNAPLQSTESPAEKDPAPSGIWVSRYYLNVIDYTDPAFPAVHKPINIPGNLKGISHNGAVIYTGGPHWNEKHETDWSEWIDASAYDEVSVHLIDSLLAGNSWSNPYLVRNGALYLAQAGTTNTPNTLQLWKLTSEGKFAQQARTELSTAASALALIGDILVVNTGYNRAAFFDATGDNGFRKVGESSSPGCIYLDLSLGVSDQASGLWFPLGQYGVWNFKIQP